MNAPRNVLILSSSTGGGHHSAAAALEHSLRVLAGDRVAVQVSEVLEEGHVIPRLMASFYNDLLRHRQHWMKYYYGAINALRPNESRLLFARMSGYRQRLWERFSPDALVSVHPMTQHFSVHLLAERGLLGRVPLMTVVTDPYSGFWKGWACEAVEQYFVASDAAKQQLADYGVSSRKVSVCGMPVHAKFTPIASTERSQLRRRTGLDPNKFTVFVNAGWAGGGNVPGIFRELIKADLNIQVVFVGGHNDRLVQEARELSGGSRFPVRVLGFSRAIHEVMQMSDVMISKPGGLTTFEAMACGLPLIIDAVTPPMPQEQATVAFAEQGGFAPVLREAREVVSVIQRLRGSPHLLEPMREAAVRHAMRGSAQRIARKILSAARVTPLLRLDHQSR